MYLSPRNCPWTCCRFVVLLFLKPVGIEGFPFLKKVVEMELKWTLRMVARSLDVENWFERTGDVLGMRRWSWFVRGVKTRFSTLH